MYTILADRAKSIKTKAVINESETDKLIRELREENARLQALLTKGRDTIKNRGGSEAGEISEYHAASNRSTLKNRDQSFPISRTCL